MSLGPVRRRRRDPALCEAAAIGDLAEVERLLGAGVSPDSLDPDGATALIAAAASGQVEVVDRLLEAGAEVDEQDDSGLTALIAAVLANGEMDLRAGHPVFLRIVELLLGGGAQVDLEDEDGETALDYARSYDLVDVVELLENAL